MGIGASMPWWDEPFCRAPADAARFVVRYDHRDTGRSVTYEHGRPGYSGADLAADVLRVLDGYGIDAAHPASVSAGGGCAQELALPPPPMFPDNMDELARLMAERHRTRFVAG